MGLFGTKASRQAALNRLSSKVHKITTKKGRQELKKSLEHQIAHPLETLQNVGKNVKSEVKGLGDRIGSELGGGVAVHALNKINPAMIAIRGAVIGVIELNVVGIATAFSLIKDSKDKKHWDEIAQKWWLLGGEKDTFANDIDRGKKKPELFSNLVHLEELEHVDENIGKKVAKAAAGIGSIGGILAAIPTPEPVTKVIGGYVATGGGVLATLAAVAGSFAKENGATAQDVAKIPPAKELPEISNPVLPDNKKDIEKVHNEIKNGLQEIHKAIHGNINLFGWF